MREQSTPTLVGDLYLDSQAIAKFFELFCTALLPQYTLTPQIQVPIPIQGTPLPKYQHGPNNVPSSSPKLTGRQRHAFIARTYNQKSLDGSAEINEELRNQIMSRQLHSCQEYCIPKGSTGQCRFSFLSKYNYEQASPFVAQGTQTLKLLFSPRDAPH